MTMPAVEQVREHAERHPFSPWSGVKGGLWRVTSSCAGEMYPFFVTLWVGHCGSVRSSRADVVTYPDDCTLTPCDSDGNPLALVEQCEAMGATLRELASVLSMRSGERYADAACRAMRELGQALERVDVAAAEERSAIKAYLEAMTDDEWCSLQIAELLQALQSGRHVLSSRD